jgi:parallel beta-helix repeat protein
MKTLFGLFAFLTCCAATAQVDNTKELQDAINKGGTINIARDSFFVKDLYIPSNTKLVGLNKPYIKAHSITFYKANNSSIEGFDIEGYTAMDQSTTLVMVLNCNTIQIVDCTVRDNFAEGIALNGSKNCKIANNKIFNTDVGVLLNGGNRDFDIIANEIRGGTSDGIADWGYSADSTDDFITINDNKIYNKKANGILTRYSRFAKIIGNYIEGCYIGITADDNKGGSRFSTIAFNTIVNSGEYGIAGSFDYSSISKNTISGSVYGMRIGSFQRLQKTLHTRISDNTIENVQVGIMLTDVDSCVLSSNTVIEGKSKKVYASLILNQGNNNVLSENTVDAGLYKILIQRDVNTLKSANGTILFNNTGAVEDQGTNTKEAIFIPFIKK